MRSNRLHLEPEDEYPRSNMEITDKSLTQSHHSSGLNNKFVKRLSPLESRSHRYNGTLNRRLKTPPRSCQLNCDLESSTAFSILRYQLNDQQAKVAHLNSLKVNLERRLQSAKAQGNQDLINILNKEFKEIMTI